LPATSAPGKTASGEGKIMKNNNPVYVVIDFKRFEELQVSGKDRMETIASKILENNLEAF